MGQLRDLAPQATGTVIANDASIDPDLPTLKLVEKRENPSDVALSTLFVADDGHS